MLGFITKFLSKENITANPSYNRWLIPPAALCVHLCIGMAYGFSVFWKPLGKVVLGLDGKPAAACAAGAKTFADKLGGTAHALDQVRSSPVTCLCAAQPNASLCFGSTYTHMYLKEVVTDNTVGVCLV